MLVRLISVFFSGFHNYVVSQNSNKQKKANFVGLVIFFSKEMKV